MARKRSRLATTLAVLLVLAGVAVTPATTAGAATSGAGTGTAAALKGPDCDPQTKRVKIVYAYLPPCVAPFDNGADNGGSTMPGVTKNAIKVVVYTGIPADQAPQSASAMANAQKLTR